MRPADLPCGGVHFYQQISGDSDFAPAEGIEDVVKPFGDRGFVSPGCSQIIYRDRKLL